MSVCGVSFSSDNWQKPVSFRRLIKFLTSYRPWVDAPSSGAIVSLQHVDFVQKARSNPNGNLVFQYCRWVIAWGYLLVLCVYIYIAMKKIPAMIIIHFG